MRILRLLVRNFRGVGEKEVRFLTEGVTVLVGPNETGKSSLAEALDLLIDSFDSSKAEKVKSVQPVHADEGPEVEADIRAGPYEFTYRKRFLRRPMTELRIRTPASENLTGRDAHDRAHAILAETVDMALWRALRIQQGAELEQPSLAGRRSLAAALDRAAGEARSGEKEESLFGAVRAEFESYFTPGRGDLRKEHQQVRDAVEAAERAVEERVASLRQVDEAVRRSAELARDLAERDEKSADLADNERKKKAELAGLQASESKLTGTIERRDAAAARKEDLDRRFAERRSLIERTENLGGALEDRRKGLVSIREELDRARKQQLDSEALLADTEGAADEAARSFGVRDRDLEFQRARLEFEQLSERRDRIETATAAASEAQVFLNGCRIDDEKLDGIRQAQTELVAATARMEAQSAALRIEALADLELEIDGEKHDLGEGDSEERHVTDDLEVTLPGRLRITARAGGGTGEVRRARSVARRRLAESLAECGASSLEEAASENEARKEAVRRVADRDRIVEENLRDLTRERLENKIRNLEARVAAYPEERSSDLPLPGSFDEAQETKRAAEKDRDSSELLRNEAFEAMRENEKALRELEKKWGQEETSITELVVRLKTDEEALASQRTQVLDDELAAEVKAFAARLRLAEGEVSEIRQMIEELNPEAVRLMAANATSVLEQAETEQRRCRSEMDRLDGKLGEMGEKGLAERVDEARQAHFRAEKEWNSLDRRARAAQTLFEVFRDKRDEARRSYVEPLAGKIRELGRIVFGPDFDVALSDELAVENRTLDERTVRFSDLSGGAREQISLLARLAGAMTVADGEGVPLILDDALGYTDPERLERMGAVLSLAGRTCQVIVMTCVPDRYRHVGDTEIVYF